VVRFIVMVDSVFVTVGMRSALSILLLLLTGFPGAAPLFAPSAEAQLPACCRRDGKHHCMMKMNMQAAGESDRPSFISVGEKCPFFPQQGTTTVHVQAGLAPAAAVFAELVAHPAFSPQTLAKFRISSLRSRQKRGPPVVLYFA
jgi:hypothetical protein